jgi:hypothetical protein
LLVEARRQAFPAELRKDAELRITEILQELFGGSQLADPNHVTVNVWSSPPERSEGSLFVILERSEGSLFVILERSEGSLFVILERSEGSCLIVILSVSEGSCLFVILRVAKDLALSSS